MEAVPSRLKTIVADPTRRIVVGGFRDEEQAFQFMVEQGHRKEDLVLVDYVNKNFWEKTGRMGSQL
jgi:hypothetical protein